MSTCTSPRRAAAEPAVAAMDRDNNDASSAPHPHPPNTSASANDHDSKLNTATLADDAEEASRPAKRSKTSSQSPAAMSGMSVPNRYRSSSEHISSHRTKQTRTSLHSTKISLPPPPSSPLQLADPID